MEAAPPNTSRSHDADSVGYIRKVEEASLSVAALLELMRVVLDRGVPFRFRAPGFSMFPFVRDGDVITVSRLPGGSPGLGRVVAFVHPGTAKLVVHRVVGKEAGSCVTRGDSTTEADGFAAREAILGYVTRVERDGRSVSIGLGVERLAIALLSRRGLLAPLVWLLGRLAGAFAGRAAT